MRCLSSALLGGFLVVLATFGVNSAMAADGTCFVYDRPDVRLSGHLQIRVYFAQPGYGENPATDARDVQAVLFLDKPLCMQASSDGRVSAAPSEIEVTLVPPQGQRLSHLAGRRIEVTGALFPAETGHHHTAVLMQVQRVIDRTR